MKIVIDIPQEIYEMCVKYHQKDYFNNPDSIIRTAIAHGSSLQRTGHWISCTVGSGMDNWECSVCGRRTRGKLENLPYCCCGAKMQEVKE